MKFPVFLLMMLGVFLVLCGAVISAPDSNFEPPTRHVAHAAAPSQQFPTGCPEGQWKVLYWGNMDLAGTPTDGGCVAGPLDKTWTDGQQPFPGIGPYQWSARYVANWPIAGGNQTFTATFDDSVRVAVDSSSLWTIDDWAFGAVRTKTGVKSVNPNVPNNLHTVWVEFRNNGYGARLKVDWTGGNPPTSTPTPVPPTNTPVPPTNTPVPPTNTPVPPTPTVAPLTDLKCPNSVHDLYKVAAPDGVMDHGWHPQQDPNYGCFMEHEHGNGGALIANAHRADGSPYKIVYGYAARVAGIAENHEAHKTYILGPGNGWGGYQYVTSHHFGTSSVNRLCQSRHELDITIIRASDGLVVGEFYSVSPHGHAVTPEDVQYTPTVCPNQHDDYWALYGAYYGQRMVNLAGGQKYEPWSGYAHPNLTGVTPALPNGRFDFAVNTTGIVLQCVTITCAQVVIDPNTDGVDRFLDLGGYGFKRGGAAANTGNYCTSVDGFQIIACAAGTIKQYAATNWDAPKRTPLGLDEECYYSPTVNGVHGENLPMLCALDPTSFPADYNRRDSQGVKRVRQPN